MNFPTTFWHHLQAQAAQPSNWQEEATVFVVLLAALIFTVLMLARRNRELHQRALEQHKEHMETVESHLKHQRDHMKLMEEKINRLIQVLEEVRDQSK